MGGPVDRLTGNKEPVAPQAGDRLVRWPGTQRPTRGKNVRPLDQFLHSTEVRARARAQLQLFHSGATGAQWRIAALMHYSFFYSIRSKDTSHPY